MRLCYKVEIRPQTAHRVIYQPQSVARSEYLSLNVETLRIASTCMTISVTGSTAIDNLPFKTSHGQTCVVEFDL